MVNNKKIGEQLNGEMKNPRPSVCCLKGAVNIVLIVMALAGILGLSNELVTSGFTPDFFHFVLIIIIAVSGRLIIDRFCPD